MLPICLAMVRGNPADGNAPDWRMLPIQHGISAIMRYGGSRVPLYRIDRGGADAIRRPDMIRQEQWITAINGDIPPIAILRLILSGNA